MSKNKAFFANLRSSPILLGVIIAVLLMRCIVQVMLPLMHQEAYYWMYAQHPSLSYYDHPPMVAWTISLGTAIFGNSEWGVRACDGLLMLIDGALMYGFARLWWSRRIAIASALLVEMSPVFFGVGLLATMNPALLGFWLLSLIGFSIAMKRGRALGWYVCGFGLGGALLSKYTGVFLIPGVGLLLLAHQPWRKWLRSPHPYLAVLLGLAMFSPVIFWNWQHDWASFRFQFLSRFENANSTHKFSLFDYLGIQIAVATPVVIAGTVIILRRAFERRRISARDKIAFTFAVPLLLSLAYKSLTYPTHMDWTTPAYLSLIPATLHAAEVHARARLGRVVWSSRLDLSTLTLPVCALINFGLTLFLLLVQPHTHSLEIFGPWDQLAAKVETFEDGLEDKTGREPLVIVDDKYELASLIAFYRNRADPDDRASTMTVNRIAIGGTAAGFAYWTDLKSWSGMNCIYVDDESEHTARIKDRFKTVKLVWAGEASNGKRYSISECMDYRGF